jgi:hypothetical protein
VLLFLPLFSFGQSDDQALDSPSISDSLHPQGINVQGKDTLATNYVKSRVQIDRVEKPLEGTSLKDTLKGVVKGKDTLVTNYLKSLVNLEVIENPFETPSLDKNTLKGKFIKKLKNIRPQGQVSIGYDYGLLTGYIDTTNSQPLNVLRSTADLSVNALGLPFKVGYNFSTFRNPLGVNNYFRISLDTERMKEQARQKKNEMAGSLDDQIATVQNGKEQLSGKMGYGEVLMQKLKHEAEKHKDQLNNYEGQLDAYKEKAANAKVDTNALMDRGLDSLNTRKDKVKTDGSKRDSLQEKYDNAQRNYQKAMELYDTVNKTYSKVKDLYDTYTDWEGQLEKYKSKLNGYEKLLTKEGLEEAAMDSLSDRKDGLLSSIKTLDLGLTYPQTTALSTNSAPVKGVNLEIQRRKWYSAVSAGIMMNNLMVSNDIVQNKLVYSENLFNQFDFQQVTQQGLLVSVKSGYGTPEGNHAFLGMRYLTNSKFSDQGIGMNTSSLIPSVGLELDTRIAPKFLPATTIDFVYGKTSDSQKLANGTRKDPFSSLFSSDRTHTGLLKIHQPVRKIRSEFTGSIRWIDPQADVRSLGVLQPNNLRYELRSTHAITRRVRIGFNYRRDRNNVDNHSDSTLHLQVVGGQLNGRIGKRISYFGSLNYLTQSNISNKQVLSRQNNYMYGAGIMAQYKIKEVENSIAFNYNDYLLTDSVSTGLFRNIGIQNMTQVSEGQNIFTLAYFKSELEGQENSSAIILGDEFSWQRKRFQLTAGFKVAFSENYRSDVGGKLEATTQVTKFMQWNIKAEKLVLGDFYNAYDRERFDRFPYAITTNLNFIIN